jgi:hypothetical protein
VDFISIAYLIDGSWLRLTSFVLALYVGGSMNAWFTGPLNDQWWEFGVGYTISASLLYLCAGRAVFIQMMVALCLGIVSLCLAARSLGGICLLTSVLYGIRYARGIFRPLAILGAAGAMVALLFAANNIILQNQNKEASNLERQSMIETATEAFITSPVIGQGSWFTASELLSRLEEKRESHDPTFHGYSEEEARQVSIHSQLLVALAEGGIFGGIFFIFYGGLLLKTLRTLTRYPVPHRAFVLYLVIAGLWDLCMSPFSGVARTEICVAVCACLLVVMQRQGELAEDFRE